MIERNMLLWLESLSGSGLQLHSGEIMLIVSPTSYPPEDGR